MSAQEAAQCAGIPESVDFYPPQESPELSAVEFTAVFCWPGHVDVYSDDDMWQPRPGIPPGTPPYCGKLSNKMQITQENMTPVLCLLTLIYSKKIKKIGDTLTPSAPTPLPPFPPYRAITFLLIGLYIQ